MASARPSKFRKGGGRLNEVDATLVSYEFSDVFPFASNTPRKKVSDFHSLFCNVTFRVDGATDTIIDPMFVGSADDFEVSEDGLTLTPVNDDDAQMRDGANFQKFIGSLIEGGFDEGDLPDDAINYEVLVNTRMRLMQRVDEGAKTKRVDAKTGKEYARTFTAVEKYYGPVEAVKPVKGAKGAPVKAAASKANGKAVAADSAVTEFADETLLEILQANKGLVTKPKLSVKSLMALDGDDRREDVRTLYFDDGYLGRNHGWVYTKANGEIRLSE